MHSFITLSDSTSNDKVCFQTFFLNKMQLCFMGHVILLLYYLRIVNPFPYSLQYVTVKWFDSYMIIGGWAGLHFCVNGSQTTICAMKNHLENLFSFFQIKLIKLWKFVSLNIIFFFFFFVLEKKKLIHKFLSNIICTFLTDFVSVTVVALLVKYEPLENLF